MVASNEPLWAECLYIHQRTRLEYSMAEKTDAILIKNFFLEKMSSREALDEIKQLNDEDKKQLGDGIRNGSLAY